MTTKCLFCNNELESVLSLSMMDVFSLNCKNCGKYKTTGILLDSHPHLDNGYLISGVLRWRKERGLKNEEILTADTIAKILQGEEIPQNIFEKIDKLILFLGMKSKRLGAKLSIRGEKDYPLIFAKDPCEILEVLKHLKKSGLIDGHRLEELDDYKSQKDLFCELTMDGWRRYYEIKQKTIDSKVCFVAMNFDDSYDVAYKAIADAVTTCGYQPYRVKEIQHNEDVTDLIIAGIKKSRFLVADFSGQKAGVYFEAGYARGLGKTVIWTCKESDKENIHFDTDHFAHIFWKDEEDLKVKLQQRIEATID